LFFWDAKNKQAMRCATTLWGNSFIPDGTVEPDVKKFDLAADVASETYGICSNKFLNKKFKTVCFEMKITIHSKENFSYDQDTQLQIKGNPNLFQHIDKNTQSRVK
jgi:hypothetical protein